MTKWIAVFLVVFSMEANASRWVDSQGYTCGGDKDESLCINEASIKNITIGTTKIKTAWWKHNIEKPREVMPGIPYDTYTTFTGHYAYNCKTGENSRIQTYFYNQSGEVVYSTKSIPKDQLEFESDPPNSIGDLAQQIICSDKLKKGKP